MVTALQIALLLILIALIGIILGYLFGRLACKKREKNLYFEKSEYCEDEYSKSLNSDESVEGANRLYNSSVTTAATEDKELSDSDSSATENSIVESQIDANAQESDLDSVNSTPQGIAESGNLAQNDVSVKASAPEESSIEAAATSVESEDNTATDEVKEDNNEEPSEADKPAVLDAPRESGKDNLCRIKGIGNVIEGKLNDLGVYHFDQIAAWSAKEIEWVDSHLAFSGRIVREDWIGQAKILAEGAETEFSKRVDNGEVSTSKKD